MSENDQGISEKKNTPEGVRRDWWRLRHCSCFGEGLPVKQGVVSWQDKRIFTGAE
jgi:hypothetical protein